MLIDWLAAGLNPASPTLFIQSHVPEHAELHLLLSMITPLGWLERVPTYKDQQEQLKEKDLATYGFLGYPLLQSADILLYRPAFVPVGEDQVAHVEITREIARRFNHLYGREPDFEAKVEKAVKSLGGRNSTLYKQLRKKFQESGRPARAGEGARSCVDEQQPPHGGRPRAAARLSRRRQRQHPARAAGAADRHAEGAGPRRPQDVEVLRQHDRPARRSGRGREEDQDDADRSGARAPHRSGRSRQMPGVGPAQDLFERRDARLGARGCRTAGIGCLDCKKPLIDKVVEEISGIRKRAQEFEDNPELVRNIVAEGAEKAREAARATLDDVRRAMNLRRGLMKRMSNESRQTRAELVVDNPDAGRRRQPPRLSPEQVEMPFAIVNGEPVTQMPKDLYIPPQALEVFLEAFEGPLDLLLYLIRRQNLDILDIPIAEITRSTCSTSS